MTGDARSRQATSSTQAFLVAKREYLENIRTRGFWLSILLLPLILIVLTVGSVALQSTVSEAQYTVLDNSGWVFKSVQEQVLRQDIEKVLAIDPVDSRLKGEARTLMDQLHERFKTDADREAFITDAVSLIGTLQRESLTVSDPRTQLEKFAQWWVKNAKSVSAYAPEVSFSRYRYVEFQNPDPAQLNQLLQEEALLGYFIIPEDPVKNSSNAQYVTRNLTNLDLQDWFSQAVTDVVQQQRIREENIPEDIATWIKKPVRFHSTHITASGAAERAGVSDTLMQWAPVGFVYLLWISIFSITQMLLTNTVEEKSNKLIEVLLSSVSATELMAGKILGIAATGLTIVICWLLAFSSLILALPSMMGMAGALDLSGLIENPVFLGSFVLYFLLGYFFYAALLCGLGSLCSNLKEAQNLMIPVQLLLFVPLMIMIPIGKDPNGMLAVVMSWIPPFTPFVMMNRAAFPPDAGTYLFTTLLMLISIFVALKMAARIFEQGILMTGKPPRLRQILNMLRRWPQTPVPEKR